jgi:hypothetical protein
MGSISKRIAWLCILLTLWSATASAAHQHSSAIESARCSVCAAALSASPKAPATLTHVTFVVVATFRPQSVPAQQRLIAFALCVRPPPNV